MAPRLAQRNSALDAGAEDRRDRPWAIWLTSDATTSAWWEDATMISEPVMIAHTVE
jgi:hypothetical protein